MAGFLLGVLLLQPLVWGEPKFRKDDSGYILVLSAGDRIVAALKAFAIDQKIKGGSFTGIGAVREVEISYYNVEQKRYVSKKFPQAVELLNLTGNLSWFEDKPWVHAHATLGEPNYQTFGGHLEEAEVSVTTEIFISPSKQKIKRFLNTDLNMKLIDLKARR